MTETERTLFDDPGLDEPGAGLAHCRCRLSFGGKTFDHDLDEKRLNAQLRRVLDVMRDGEWRTLAEIADSTGDHEVSVSARLRDLRKPQFGGRKVERRRRGEPKAGLFEYRVIG